MNRESSGCHRSVQAGSDPQAFWIYRFLFTVESPLRRRGMGSGRGDC